MFSIAALALISEGLVMASVQASKLLFVSIEVELNITHWSVTVLLD